MSGTWIICANVVYFKCDIACTFVGGNHMYIVPIVNQKGGVGKTTVCRHLMKMLTESGYRVLALDMDAQRNLDVYLGVAIDYNDRDTPNMYHVLREESTIKNAVISTEDGDIVRADNRMYGFTGKPLITYEEALSFKSNPQGLYDHVFHNIEKLNDKKEGERTLLRRALLEVKDDYDFVLIDTNPDLGYLTTLSLLSGDEIFPLIPAFSEESSYQSIGALYDTISTILRIDYTTSIKITGILISKYERTSNEKALLDDIIAFASEHEIHVFDSKIPKSIAVAEAMSVATNAFARRKKSALEKAYRAFCKEFLDQINTLSSKS